MKAKIGVSILEIARKIAGELFCNGYGQIAQRLVLELAGDADGGGWGRGQAEVVVQGILERYLEEDAGRAKSVAIEDCSYETLLRRWRFSPVGDPMMQGEAGVRYARVMQAKRLQLGPDGAVAASMAVGWIGPVDDFGVGLCGLDMNQTDDGTGARTALDQLQNEDPHELLGREKAAEVAKAKGGVV